MIANRSSILLWRGSTVGVRWMSQNPARAKVPMDLLKLLRTETGAPIGNIRSALSEANNDLDKARKILRSKFNAQYLKRKDNATSEGAVMAKLSDDSRSAALVQLSCETDFVARTEKFRDTIKLITSRLLETETSVDDLQSSCDEAIKEAVGSLGEAVRLKNVVRLRSESPDTIFSKYVHNMIEPNIGRIGVLVEVYSKANSDEDKRSRVQEVCKQLAMQVAAMSPQYLSVNDIPGEASREHVTSVAQSLRESGKDDIHAEAEALASMRSWVNEIALLEQKFVIDQSGESTVGEAVKSLSEEVKAPVEVKRFHRFSV
mmetsp:Transcript_6389/g.19321  ORF Transcript_6389/g.19321 Transcript_6389/m.19321 type:complete len:317 (+) Transcript_6389:118-1068(+)